MIKRTQIPVQSKKSFEFIDITDKLQDFVSKSKVKEGFLLARATHTTGAVICNENDPSIHRDAERLINDIIPLDRKYDHDYEGNVNARAHQAAMYFGNSTWVPISKGKIELGTWQRIFFIELFEPRRRKIDVVIVS